MPYKLSPSSLSLMTECERCFWIEHNLKKKRPSGIFPSLPSGMDRILKEHFDRFMEKGKMPPELKELKDFKLFSDKELLKAWRSNFKGISYTDNEGNILHGAIDNLLVKDNKLIVLDYKTRGFPLKEDTHEKYQNQLDIYNFLLRENGFDTENYSYLLFYYPEHVLETGEVVFETKLIKMTTDAGNGLRLFSKALKLLKGECPSKCICEWCHLVEI